MESAKPSNRHWKHVASEHLPALSEVATAWSPRLKGSDGPAATPRSAKLPSSHSANSRPTASTAYAKYIGRVGALAVALGIGVTVATGQGMGVARADDSPPADPPSAPSDTSPDTPPAGPSSDLNTPT